MSSTRFAKLKTLNTTSSIVLATNEKRFLLLASLFLCFLVQKNFWSVSAKLFVASVVKEGKKNWLRLGERDRCHKGSRFLERGQK